MACWLAANVPACWMMFHSATCVTLSAFGIQLGKVGCRWDA